ncbi:MAG TPA: hypothetical protein VJZ69_05285 [Clostridia bacterium]|nr:hypothetical protein [Clostridia bacterium]
MKNLIEMYVYEVKKQLPESERAEVGRELEANIYDMLPENPSENEIKSVLEKLGSPEKLAEKFRQNPKYLISPAYYNQYINSLKLFVPIIIIFAAVVGFIVGLVESLSANYQEIENLIEEVITSTLSTGISAGFVSAVFITIGFVIAERVNTNNQKSESVWSVDNLKEIPKEKYKTIPLTDSIISIALTIIFSVLAILVATNVFDRFVWIKISEYEVSNIFDSEFLRICLYIIPIFAVLQIIKETIKIVSRKWNIAVFVTVIVTNLLMVAGSIFLLLYKPIFSGEFISFLANIGGGQTENISTILSGKIFIYAVSATIVFGYLIDSGIATFKTFKKRI